jgi:dTDP-4-dehydrorhamnose reductase
MYCESDLSDATDLYGKSKFIGEIFDSPTTITMRKSVIGHELNSNNGLIEWFLSQSGTVTGYKKAIFSGMPTVELARIVEQYVIPRPELNGLYHVSVEPIDKMSLLKLVAKEYGKNIEIIPEEKFSIDRSLDSSRFRKITGYSPPSWTDLINLMHKSQ